MIVPAARPVRSVRLARRRALDLLAFVAPDIAERRGDGGDGCDGCDGAIAFNVRSGNRPP